MCQIIAVYQCQIIAVYQCVRLLQYISVRLLQCIGVRSLQCISVRVIVPTALYGAEAWGMRRAERKKVNVLEMKYLRSLAGV